MQINEQELAEAVERLREGDDNGLLVKYYDVIEAMATDKKQVEIIIEMLLDDSMTIANDVNDELFSETARALLIQAKSEAGL